MHTSFGHADSSPPTPILTLDAVVPSTGVTSVGVLAGGTTVARRTRSAHRPTVRVVGIPSFGPRYALVRWRATDRDHDALVVQVDYSGDGGRTWKTVWLGPNRGRAQLPARYLFRSPHASVRVTAGDGFRSTTASSRPFSSPGRPPVVQILAPWTGTRQPNDAPLVLSGQAFDDSSQLLTGRHLRWLLGRRMLGTGARITVSGLPGGRHRIALLASDRFGRRGVASVVVVLRASRPLFLTLQAPRTLRRSARTLRLTVAVSLPAALVTRAGGLRPQRFAVGRRPRRLTVHVRPGRASLTVRLSPRAGGLSRTETISIPRS
jgi:hypothetical protein